MGSLVEMLPFVASASQNILVEFQESAFQDAQVNFKAFNLAPECHVHHIILVK